MFAHHRNRCPEQQRSRASATSGLVREAEIIVRRAWLRDLSELRRLAEAQLQTAVADQLAAYESLHRAYQERDPQGIADAHAVFEAATRLTDARTEHRERIKTLFNTEFAVTPLSSTPTVDSAVWTGWRKLATVVRRLGRRLASPSASEQDG